MPTLKFKVVCLQQKHEFFNTGGWWRWRKHRGGRSVKINMNVVWIAVKIKPVALNFLTNWKHRNSKKKRAQDLSLRDIRTDVFDG